LLSICALCGADTARAAQPLTWDVDSTQPPRFVAVHGRRAALFGSSEVGLEVWAYPLHLADSFRVGFRPQHGTTEIDGRTVLRRNAYSPAAVPRIHDAPRVAPVARRPGC